MRALCVRYACTMRALRVRYACTMRALAGVCTLGFGVGPELIARSIQQAASMQRAAAHSSVGSV
eukprot:2316080-Alexandrium_andersonii.AAC.1